MRYWYSLRSAQKTFQIISKSDDFGATIRLKSQDYSMYRFQTPLAWFEALVDSVDARGWILEHFENRNHMYLLTGLQMLRGGELRKIKSGR